MPFRVFAGSTLAAVVLAVAFPIAALADSGVRNAVDRVEYVMADASALDLRMTDFEVGKVSFTWNAAAMNPRNYTPSNSWCELWANDSAFPGMIAGYETTEDGSRSSATLLSGAIHAGDIISVNITCHNTMADPTDDAPTLSVNYVSPSVRVRSAAAAKTKKPSAPTTGTKAHLPVFHQVMKMRSTGHKFDLLEMPTSSNQSSFRFGKYSFGSYSHWSVKMVDASDERRVFASVEGSAYLINFINYHVENPITYKYFTTYKSALALKNLIVAGSTMSEAQLKAYAKTHVA